MFRPDTPIFSYYCCHGHVGHGEMCGFAGVRQRAGVGSHITAGRHKFVHGMKGDEAVILGMKGDEAVILGMKGDGAVIVGMKGD